MRNHSIRRPGFIKPALILITLAGAGVGVYAVTRSDDSGAAANNPTADLAAARMMSFDIRTTATGELEAASQVELRCRLEQPSTVVSIVDEGSFVAAGTELVRLNSDDLETKLDEELAALEEERAELESARNALAIQESDNQSALEDAELQLRLATLELEQWREGDRVRTLEELTLAVERAERELNRLKEQFERSQELFAQGFESKNAFDLAELAYIEAQANLRTAKLDLEIFETYQVKKDEEQRASDVDQARAEVDRVKKQNTIRLSDKEADVLREERSVLRITNRVSDLRRQIEASVITAPSDGLVVYGTTINNASRRWNQEGPLAIGKDVRPNELLIALPDISQMVASVRVHESLAGRIRPGQAAQLRIDALAGATLDGTVESVGVLAESGNWRDPNLREYTVRIALKPSELSEKLKPSMRAEASIAVGRVEESLTIPVQALFGQGGLRYVYTPQGNKFIRKPVRAGRTSDLQAEILAGLSPDEIVLIREPSPGEIIEQPWQEEQLAEVGFKLSDEGEPIPAQGRRPGPRGG